MKYFWAIFRFKYFFPKHKKNIELKIIFGFIINDLLSVRFVQIFYHKSKENVNFVQKPMIT